MGIVHAGSLGYVRERAIPIVVEQKIASTFQTSWTALHGEAVILAGFARTKFGKVIEVEVDVVGNEEVYPAVAVIVPKGGAGGELYVIKAGLFGDIGEGAVAVVAVEDNSAEAGHQRPSNLLGRTARPDRDTGKSC